MSDSSVGTDLVDPGKVEGAPDGSVQRRSSRWAALSIGIQIVKAVLLFASQIVLARLLSPAEFGIVAIASPLLNFITLFGEIGLSQAAVQRQEIDDSELSQLFTINIILGLAISLLVAALAGPVSMVFHEERLRMVLVILGGTVAINSFSWLQVALMFRHMRATQLALIDIVPVSLNIASSIAAAMAGLSYWSLVIGQIVHALAAACLAWALSDWRPSLSLPRFSAKNSGTMSMVTFGSHVTGYNLIAFFGSNLDNMLIGARLGDTAVGLYDRGFKLVLMSYLQIAMPVSRIAQSLLARLLQQEAAYVRAFNRMLEGSMLMILPGLVCLAATSEAAVSVLFGPAWTLTAPVVQWLAIGSILAPVATSGTWLFVSQARTKPMLIYGAISTAVVIVSLLVGLPWGITGVAISYALFSVVIHGVVIYGATREGPVTLHGVVLASAPVLVATMVSAILVCFWRWQYPFAASSPVVIVGLGLLYTYGGTGLALACFPAGRQTLRNVVSLASNLR